MVPPLSKMATLPALRPPTEPAADLKSGSRPDSRAPCGHQGLKKPGHEMRANPDPHLEAMPLSPSVPYSFRIRGKTLYNNCRQGETSTYTFPSPLSRVNSGERGQKYLASPLLLCYFDPPRLLMSSPRALSCLPDAESQPCRGSRRDIISCFIHF